MIETTETHIIPPYAAEPDAPAYDACDQCSAPMDEAQRYCVVCGAYRHNAGDPVARYLSSSRRPRAAAAPVAVASAGRSDNRWTLLALVLLPVAAAAGVLVGRGGNSSNDDILAALKAQKAPIVRLGGSGAGAASAGGGAAAGAGTISRDFALSKGFVVKLRTLPATSDTAAVTDAKRAAKAKGASDVGVINPSDFTLKPGTGGAYLVYSGEFKARAQAAKALAKLKKKFPG